MQYLPTLGIMRYARIPDQTIRRLPLYLRALFLMAEQGQTEVSSKDLSEHVGVHAWQVRKDFSFFGEFGRPGVGYQVSWLTDQIKTILRLDSEKKAVLVGVGNLGAAVLSFSGFNKYNLTIIAAFDADVNKIGQTVGGVEIRDVACLDSVGELNATLAVITVPGQVAQAVVDPLVNVGIRGILNFTSCRLIVPDQIRVTNIDIGMDLASLPYYI
ncbi:MAG: redox-sensing transcriptional repressor Rex [Phycisphaerae bacterium]|nr:redox-sensing transcriptional repressor Rex [Phycisphaerae bacterium]